jgi:fructose transport system substrate-binding protein
VFSFIAGVALLSCANIAGAEADEIAACLITKTDTNPFFVKMREGAESKAKELGITLKSYAGKIDGDNDSQVAAIESCIADGVKGILLSANDSSGIVPFVKEARNAGILVVNLDSPLDPYDAADAVFATDNVLAGKLIGEWAAKTLGDKARMRALPSSTSMPIRSRST